MKKVFFYLFLIYMGIVVHILFFKSLPELKQIGSPNSNILEHIKEDLKNDGELSQGFARIIEVQAQKEKVLMQTKEPEFKQFQFLANDSDNMEIFSKKLYEYAQSEEAHVPQTQVEILDFCLNSNQNVGVFLNIAIHSMTLALQEHTSWSKRDTQEIITKAHELIRTQVSDPYELERINKELSQIGLNFEKNYND